MVESGDFQEFIAEEYCNFIKNTNIEKNNLKPEIFCVINVTTIKNKDSKKR